ncbi:MAG TPA: cell division protein DivIVA [Clostridiales bacterium]|nr:cell division protein DivIVA [Clostridiales bacterium]
MMTPQEVASHAFAKATLGGYNMAMVDEFLDQLTADYTALYNDNAILKNKLKVLSETVEEYRATDTAMRKLLLTAQQKADSIVSDAEKQKTQIVHQAEVSAHAHVAELKAAADAEEYRLEQARQSTARCVEQLKALYTKELEFLARLSELAPESASQADPSSEIEASVSALYSQQTAAQPSQAPAEEASPAQEVSQPAAEAAPAAAPVEEDTAPYAPVREVGRPPEDMEATRRFDNLQFGKDYEIR